jgi:hypothetical protein
MIEETETVREDKTCPICLLQLPLSEFGICRARKDGRNLYCKSCIRKKVTQSRRALKEYKTARKRFIAQPVLDSAALGEVGSDSLYPRVISRMSPVERVLDAIRKGARTQKAIAQETKMGKDEIGDALANLLLWTREIRTEVVDNTRMYLVNENLDTVVTHPAGAHFPRRKSDVPGSFSALQGLMPGRNPEGEPEKIGGWVAA